MDGPEPPAEHVGLAAAGDLAAWTDSRIWITLKQATGDPGAGTEGLLQAEIAAKPGTDGPSRTALGLAGEKPR